MSEKNQGLLTFLDDAVKKSQKGSTVLQVIDLPCSIGNIINIDTKSITCYNDKIDRFR